MFAGPHAPFWYASSDINYHFHWGSCMVVRMRKEKTNRYRGLNENTSKSLSNLFRKSIALDLRVWFAFRINEIIM